MKDQSKREMAEFPEGADGEVAGPAGPKDGTCDDGIAGRTLP